MDSVAEERKKELMDGHIAVYEKRAAGIHIEPYHQADVLMRYENDTPVVYFLWDYNSSEWEGPQEFEAYKTLLVHPKEDLVELMCRTMYGDFEGDVLWDGDIFLELQRLKKAADDGTDSQAS